MAHRSPKRRDSRNQVHLNTVALAKRTRHGVPTSKRSRGTRADIESPFIPPEDWHEPEEEPTAGYEIIVQPPGEGLRHVLTPADIRDRLSQLPAEFTKPLQVVQLSRMTRKKSSFPCYGMQWGPALYLYPIEDSLIEYCDRPPQPSQQIEARMFGVEWQEECAGCWKLEWTRKSIRDFYLNNILIHELGHLLDDRNTSYIDRERYAEWFAIEYGVKSPDRKRLAAKAAARVKRRHHSR